MQRVMIALVILTFFGCKSKSSQKKSIAQDNIEKSVPELEKPLSENFENLQNQHLNFEKEFLIFLSAANKYMETDIYKNPKNSADILLAAVAKLIPEISEWQLKNFILQKQFHLFAEQLDKLSQFDLQAQDILVRTSSLLQPHNSNDPLSSDELKSIVKEHNKNSPSLQEKEKETETTILASPNTPSDPTDDIPSNNSKQPLVIESGAFLIILGSIGLIGHGIHRIPEIYHGGIAEYQKKFFFNVFLQDLPLFGKFAYLMTIGGLLIARSENPSEATIEKAQELFIGLGIIGGLVAVYYGLEYYANTLGRNTFLAKSLGQVKIEDYKDVWFHYDFVEALRGKANNWLPSTPQSLKVKRNKQDVLTGWQTINGEELRVRSVSVGKRKAILNFFAAVAAATATIVWEQKALTLASETSPQSIFLYKVARFYRICEILARKGMLILN